MPEWLTTLLGAIGGASLSMLGGWLADHRLTKREREHRKDERRERLTTRRNEFQRETLLALQVSSQKLLRTTGSMHIQDTIAHRKTGTWQKERLPENLNEDHLQFNTDSMLLASRVRDEEVRKLCEDLRKTLTAVSFSSGEDESNAAMLKAAEIQRALLQRTGQLVRELDEVENG